MAKTTEIEMGAPDPADWAELRLAAGEVLAELWADDAAALAKRPIEHLWAAEGLWRAKSAHSSHADLARLGWAGLCVDASSGSALAWLLERPFFLGGRAADAEAYDGLLMDIAALAVKAKSGACLAAVASRSQAAAWGSAELCLVHEDEGFSWRAREAWFAGYEVALPLAMRWGAPSGAAVKKCHAAIAGALRRPWADKASTEKARAIALEAADALRLMGAPSQELFAAAAGAAVDPGAAQGRAWEVCKEMSEAMGHDWRAGLPPSMFGLKTSAELGGEALPKPERSSTLFPEMISPAWVAASRVRDLAGVAQARRMAADMRAGGREPAPPTLSPGLAGLSHPLDILWDLWEHSKRAGFVLPQRPFDASRSRFKSSIADWERRVPGPTVEQWKVQGGELLAAMGAGRIPASFPGHSKRPVLDQAIADFSKPLSPMALAWSNTLSGRDSAFTPERTMQEQHMAAVALAQDGLGFDLDASCGGAFHAKFMASAQRQVLAMASAQPASAPSRPPRI